METREMIETLERAKGETALPYTRMLIDRVIDALKEQDWKPFPRYIPDPYERVYVQIEGTEPVLAFYNPDRCDWWSSDYHWIKRSGIGRILAWRSCPKGLG